VTVIELPATDLAYGQKQIHMASAAILYFEKFGFGDLIVTSDQSSNLLLQTKFHQARVDGA